MLIALNKPFRVLCQFRDPDGRTTLANYLDVPDVYPAGRLDFDSEGLLLLTDNGKLQASISDPRAKVAKHYWAQVEGDVRDEQLHELCSGVTLKDGRASAAGAKRIQEPDGLWNRDPPIRVRQRIPTSWIDIALTEGRNRQVRRMTAAVGLPTLRLIRHRIGNCRLDGLQPGEWRDVGGESV